MAEKSRDIIQCPFCDSNRLYFRRGLVSDVLISLILPVKSYTCGSCSRSFRKYGNYFTSKQALIHIFGLLAILAFINPDLLLPESWLLQEQQISRFEEQPSANTTSIEDKDELPLLSLAIANATNSSFVVENGTITMAKNILHDNATPVSNSTSPSMNATEQTIMAFNGTETLNSTNWQETAPAGNSSGTAEKRLGLQSGKLKSIYFKAVKGVTRIELDLGGSPLSYTSFFLRDPNRLVVDIHGNWEYYGPTTLRPENPIFSKFRIGIYENKIRMVMDLKGQTPAPVIRNTANGLNIDVK